MNELRHEMPCIPEAGSPFARVMVSPPAQFRGLFERLVMRLSEAGSRLLIISPTPERADYWRERTAELAGVDLATNNARYDAARRAAGDETALFARAREHERRLGTTINMLAVRDRHLGRGYAPGGFRHPRSQISERTSYAQMVAGIVAELDQFTEMFESFKPTLVVNSGLVPYLMSARAGVPYRRLVGSRTENFYQWAHTEYFENPRIRVAFDRLKGPFEPFSLERPYKANEKFVTSFAARVTRSRIVKNNALAVARHAYWRLKGYEKAKGYFPTEELTLPWRSRADYRAMSGGSTVPLSTLAGKRFVFYPLQTEPEAALQGLSPEYLFQLESIIRISRDLPAGVLLAVKDTPIALGRRPTDFYRQILELKNVVLLDIRERGVDVVNAAAAIVTICGTAGFEGAITGKPVIVFGKHNPYDFLGHVIRIDSNGTLADALERALSGGIEPKHAQSEGARYLQAVRDVSFRLESIDVFKPTIVDDKDVSRAFASLAESLGTPAISRFSP